MHFFTHKRGVLHAEGVPVERIVEKTGTPVYVYSKKTLKRHFKSFDRSFASVKRLVCYSVKANSNLAVLRAFANEGSGFDIVSAGELYRALKAGADPGKVVFSGVGKRADEMEYAIKSGILMFNVESPEELRALDAVAGRLRRKASFAIRVNPDVDPKTHPYISTGLKKNKFGMPEDVALREYVHARANFKNVEAIGVDCHIGSQITSISPFVDALKKTRALVEELRRQGIAVKYLDMGGGLGITYDTEAPPHPTKYGEAVMEGTRRLGVTLVFEPGRVLVGNAGMLIGRVVYTKENAGKRFIIVDAAMNDLARPSLYGSYHAIKAVRQKGTAEVTADVVGPICESGDFLAKDRLVPDFSSGDLVAVMSAGAYGFSMSSNYNARPRAAEVMVDGRDFEVVRGRETFEDLIRGESAGAGKKAAAARPRKSATGRKR